MAQTTPSQDISEYANYQPSKVILVLIEYSNKIHQKMEHLYGRLAISITNHPYITISMALFCILLSLISINFFLVEDSEAYSIWVPQDSQSVKDFLVIEDVLNGFPRALLVIAKHKDESGLNVATKSNLLNLFDIHDSLFSNGYEDYCDRYYSNSPCNYNTPLQFWDMNKTTLINDPDIFSTLSLKNKTTPEGIPISLTILGGGIEYSGQKVSSISAFRLIYSMNTSNSEFELDMVDYLKKYKQMTLSFITPDSVNVELARTTNGDIGTYIMSYLFMFFYAAFNLGSFPLLKRSKLLLALGAIACVLFGILISFGIAAAAQLPTTSLIAIEPFILTAIGIDNVFVIWVLFRGLHLERDLPAEQRIIMTLKEAGPLLTLTTLSDFVAFLVGLTSKMRAVQWFCIYASLSVICIFFMVLCVFTALILLDNRRVMQKKLDFVVCIKNEDVIPLYIHDHILEKKPWYSSIIRNYLTKYHVPFLLKKPVKIAVLVIFAILIGVGIALIPSLSNKFEITDLVPDDSYVIDFTEDNDNFFGHLGSSLGLFIFREGTFKGVESYSQRYTTTFKPPESGPPYFHTIEVQKALANLNSYISSSDLFDPPFISWYDNFQFFYSQNPLYNGTLVDGYLINKTSFYNALDDFTNPSTGPGRAFKKDLAFDDNGDISACRMNVVEAPVKTQVEGAEIMLDIRSELSGKFSEFDLIAFRENYLFFEQVLNDLYDAFSNAILAVVLMAFISIFFMPHPTSAALLVFTVAVADLLLMGVWFPMVGIAINSISTMNILLGVGLLIDFSAHICHSFTVNEGNNNDERILKAMKEIGPAVISGGITTFLGIMALAFSNSSAFRVFFKSLTGIVILGLISGLILLPVLLSYFGPPPLSICIKGTYLEKTLELPTHDINDSGEEDSHFEPQFNPKTGGTSSSEEDESTTISMVPIPPVFQ